MSVFLVVVMVIATCCMTSVSASDVDSFDIFVYGGKKVLIQWDEVENADTYSVYICVPNVDYLVEETVFSTSYDWEPPYVTPDDECAVYVTAYDKDGSVIAVSTQLLLKINVIHYDYWSVYGDTDFDSRVTVVDATNILRYKAELDEFSDASRFVSDVDSDGIVTVMDATRIQHFCAGIVKEPSSNLRLGEPFWYGGVEYDVMTEYFS